MEFRILLFEDLLETGTLKVDRMILNSLNENEIINLAKIIDNFATFKIEIHDESNGKIHKDPKISINAESSLLIEILKKSGITINKGLVILYLEDVRFLLGKIHKYLKKKNRQAEKLKRKLLVKIFIIFSLI